MTTLLYQILSTPVIAYLLLTVLAVEAVALFVVWKDRKIGIPPFQIVTFLGAGAAFSLALGGVLAGAGEIWLALCLCVAFIFHIMDMKLRWQSET